MAKNLSKPKAKKSGKAKPKPRAKAKAETTETERSSAQGGSVISKSAFSDLLHDCAEMEGKGAKIRGDLGSILTKAEAEHNLDKKAFAVIRRCARMESARLNCFLRNFDQMRGYAKLDDLAGKDAFQGETGKNGKAKKNGKGKQVADAPEGSDGEGDQPGEYEPPPGAGKSDFSRRMHGADGPLRDELNKPAAGSA